MCKRQTNQMGRRLKKTSGKTTEIVSFTGKSPGSYFKRAVFVLLVLGCSAGTIWAIANGYAGRVQGLAEEIVLNAEELRDVTSGPAYNRVEVDEILAELKELISEYEAAMVFAESPYPGEIMLGSTPGGDGTWLEALCSTRYEGPLKEIRIRRTGHRANYLRINDIEVTYLTSGGKRKEVFNKGGRVKLYHDKIFTLSLPRPMRVVNIRVLINHRSAGLEVHGVY